MPISPVEQLRIFNVLEELTVKGSSTYLGIFVLFVSVLGAELLFMQVAPQPTIHLQNSASLPSAWNQSSLNNKKYSYGLDSHRSKVLQVLVKRR